MKWSCVCSHISDCKSYGQHTWHVLNKDQNGVTFLHICVGKIVSNKAWDLFSFQHPGVMKIQCLSYGCGEGLFIITETTTLICCLVLGSHISDNRLTA